DKKTAISLKILSSLFRKLVDGVTSRKLNACSSDAVTIPPRRRAPIQLI
ncbi:unnamed protein product, partial [Oikopleura dioica]